MTEHVLHRGVRIEKHGLRWRWRAQVDGARKIRSALSIDEARRLLDEFLDEAARMSRRSESAVTIGNLCDEWFVAKVPQLAPGTAKQYEIHIRVHIGPLFGSLRADTIKPVQIAELYRALRWKSAKESHNILRQAFDWGLQNGILLREANPFRFVRPSRRSSTDADDTFDFDDRIRPISEKDIPTAEEVEKLLLDAEGRQDRTWWLYLKLATATGARPGEVAALRRSAIDIERGLVSIEWTADKVGGRLKRPKSPSSIREIPLSRGLLDEISAALPRAADEFLFPSNTYQGGRSPLPCWNSRSIKRRLDRALQRTGVRHITPHSFRHYVATRLLAAGSSPTQVARYLGHADDSLVRKLYGNHIVDEAQRQLGELASKLH